MRHTLLSLITFTSLVFTIPSAMGKISPTIAKKVMDAVVRIDVKSLSHDPPYSLQEELEKNNPYGSGFVFRSDGYIATNLHVLGDERKVIESIDVTFNDGSRKPAKIVGYDRFLDLLVLKVEATSLPVIAFGDSSKVLVTNTLYAFGHPLGLSHSIIEGFVSALDRDISTNDCIMASRSFPEGIKRNLIQIDGNLNPGLSGGPVTDEFGNVVGMSSSNFGNDTHSVGIGFCFPINLVTASLKTIRETGKPIVRGALGVHTQPLDEPTVLQQELKELSGVLVTNVDLNSPASLAGINIGDILLSINGHPVNTVSKLRYVIKSAPLGEKISVTLFRQGHILRKIVTLAMDPNDRLPMSPDLLSSSTPLTESLGFSFLEPCEDKRIVVTQFTPTNLNRTLRIQPKDIIAAINSTPVNTPEELNFILTQIAKTQSTAILLVIRDGKKLLETLKLR